MLTRDVACWLSQAPYQVIPGIPRMTLIVSFRHPPSPIVAPDLDFQVTPADGSTDEGPRRPGVIARIGPAPRTVEIEPTPVARPAHVVDEPVRIAAPIVTTIKGIRDGSSLLAQNAS